MGNFWSTYKNEPVPIVYGFKPTQQQCKDVDDLLVQMPESVMSLDLTSRVDDFFVAALCAHPKSVRICNLDLSNTAVTDKSLELILGSRVIGTVRDLPSQLTRYERLGNQIYVKTQGTQIKNVWDFARPVQGVRLQYSKFKGNGTQNRKTAEDEPNGLKIAIRTLQQGETGRHEDEDDSKF